MKTLETHKVDKRVDTLTLTADTRDEQCGNASHEYAIEYVNAEGKAVVVNLGFQRGPLHEVGVNGITNEVLLAVLIDRLEGFQAGSFSCDENSLALVHVEQALHALNARTRARIIRDVEGTSIV